ncbi:hypothetical protein CRENBAI_003472 [Crenichthys baileyi]|uniref:Uncharacterized protein n=1 Tax=Crenichthys baileyi TaxID=28760 RepID=A0AAV9REE7_9TELE
MMVSDCAPKKTSLVGLVIRVMLEAIRNVKVAFFFSSENKMFFHLLMSHYIPLLSQMPSDGYLAVVSTSDGLYLGQRSSRVLMDSQLWLSSGEIPLGLLLEMVPCERPCLCSLTILLRSKTVSFGAIRKS